MLLKQKIIKVQVGKRGRERSEARGRDLSARDSIHSTTLGSIRIANRLVRQEMSRTPSCTMQYFYPDFNRAGEARATHRKSYYFLAVQPLRMRTREYPVDIDRQTTPS